MIRFKKSPADDVPAPPAGYATLFVDQATGLPAAKNSEGAVTPLKGAPGEPGEDGAPGTGIPAGGTLGQVILKGAEGPEWGDAPGGSSDPAGTWTSMLPPDGERLGGDGNPWPSGSVEALLEEVYVSLSFSFARTLSGVVATRLRGVATVTVDIIKADPGLPEAGACVFEVGGEVIPMPAGLNHVVFEIPVPTEKNDNFGVDVAAYFIDMTNVVNAWVSINVTQLEYLMTDTCSVDTTPLTMTPIVIKGLGTGGSGGFHIPKAGALATATVIEIVGYYDKDATALVGADVLYAPRWIAEADYVAVTPTAIPVFGEGSGYEGEWGWYSGGAPLPLPDDGAPESPDEVPFIALLSVDGAPPVLAVLANQPGV